MARFSQSETIISISYTNLKDYLIVNASHIIFPAGPGRIHYNVFSRSLKGLSKTLRQDIYNLQDPGSMGKDVPDPDQLGSIRYSCVFWVDHLCKADDQSRKELSYDGAIFSFLREHFLESLSLTQAFRWSTVDQKAST